MHKYIDFLNNPRLSITEFDSNKYVCLVLTESVTYTLFAYDPKKKITFESFILRVRDFFFLEF